MKLCKDCKNFLPNKDSSFHKCAMDEDVSLVTGEIVYQYCSVQRTSLSAADCGPHGKWFEPVKEVA